MAGGWGNKTHRPLGCKHNKRPGGIPIILGVAFVGEEEVYLWGEPLLLQQWPEGDSQRKEGMSGVYHCRLKLVTSPVRLGSLSS